MLTRSGILELGKREQEALRVIKEHTLIDLSFEGEGSYNKGDSDNSYDEKEAKKARRGIEVIDFILKITE